MSESILRGIGSRLAVRQSDYDASRNGIVLRLGDLVGFTGSASTAEKLRAHDSVQTGGVRFTSETDSINASILARSPLGRWGRPEGQARRGRINQPAGVDPRRERRVRREPVHGDARVGRGVHVQQAGRCTVA